MMRGAKTKPYDQKKLDDYLPSKDDYYMPEFGLHGKKIPGSEWGGHKSFDEWDRADIVKDELTLDILNKRFTKEINELKEKIQELEGKGGVMKRIKVNPRAFDELFEILNTAPSKFKSRKEFEKWMEEGE